MLVIWPKQIKGGQVFDGVTSALDLLPTFVALADSTPDPDDELDGVNLLPYLLGDEGGDPHETLYCRIMSEKGRSAVLHKDMKYTNWEGHESVFNLEEDPAEQRDLMPSDPAIVEQYRDMMIAWEQNTVEPLWWWKKKAEEKYEVTKE